MTIENNTFEVIVIGGGPGGYVAAIRAAQKGYKTACISPILGGTCLHEGCIPSKFLLNVSEHYKFMLEHAQDFGLNAENVTFDLTQIMQKKNKIIQTLSKGIEHLLHKNQVKYFQQKCILMPNKQVKLDNNTILNASHAVILAAGSKILEIDFYKDGDKKLIDNSATTLEWSQVPENLLVVGAGYIGLELASVWNRLGSKVTIVDLSTEFLPFLDKDVSDTILKALQKDGIDIRLGVSVKEYHANQSMLSKSMLSKDMINGQASNKIDIVLTDGSKITVDKFLSAVGRKAVDPIWPANIVCEKGFVKVDKHYQTTEKGVYAVGDLVAGALLAHRASDQGWCAVEHLYSNNPPLKSNNLKVCVPSVNLVPSVIYLDPEIAIVGATERELQAAKIEYNVHKMPLKSNGRAMTLMLDTGFVKVLSSKKDQKVLGVCAVGYGAESMICQAAVGMSFGATTHDFATVCYPHPSVDEVLRETMFAGSQWGALHG